MGKQAQEACQLFIEQEIEKGLAEDKTPSKIAKELVPWLDKLFEVVMPARTIEQRARRQKGATTVANDITPESDKEKQEIQEFKTHGGSREGASGAGRPPKFSIMRYQNIDSLDLEEVLEKALGL